MEEITNSKESTKLEEANGSEHISVNVILSPTESDASSAATSKESTKLEEANDSEHISLIVTPSPTESDAPPATTSEHFEFWDEVSHDVRLLPKVPAFVRDKYNSDDYDPLVVSIGPYHHGHPRLQFVEELKPQIWNLFVSRTPRYGQDALLNAARRVDDLRSSYVEGSTEKYDDDEFARMMLQDAAFIVEYMKAIMNTRFEPERLKSTDTLLYKLGRGVVEHVTRDLYVLENQIPFWFLNCALWVRYDGTYDGTILLMDFLNWSSFRSIEVVGNWVEPGNLVEAVRTVVIGGCLPSPTAEQKLFSDEARPLGEVIEVEGSTLISALMHSFHSVTELKSKGIRIKRSRTNSLLDVSFHSGVFFSTLQLPAALANVRTKSVYSNIIAYEMCSTFYKRDYIVTAYVILMKSLTESTRDVKELQDKGVMKNMLGSDEEVVKLYKDIYTYGIDFSTVYGDAIYGMQQHCNSKARTWLADLLYSYFHSPWTAIALLGSLLVILLTFTQTYYAVHP